MNTKIQILLTPLFAAVVGSSMAIAEETPKAATSAVVEAVKPAEVQAIDKAHEAAGAVSSNQDEISKQASTVTDDEGMAEEDMEMPEEDLDDAPAGSLAE